MKGRSTVVVAAVGIPAHLEDLRNALGIARTRGSAEQNRVQGMTDQVDLLAGLGLHRLGNGLDKLGVLQRETLLTGRLEDEGGVSKGDRMRTRKYELL